MLITHRFVTRMAVLAALLFGRGRTGEVALRWHVELIGDSSRHAMAVAVFAA